MRAVAMLLGIGVLWGLSFTLSRIIVGGGAHPVAVAFWHAVMGCAVLTALGFRLRLDRATLRFCAVAGMTGTALPSVLVLVAAQHVTAGVLSVCMAMAPILCLSFCAALGVERFEARRAAGLAAGLAAVGLIAAPGGAAPTLWALLAVCAAASYATEEVYIALRRPPDAHPFALLAGMQGAAALYLAPLTLALGAPWPLAAEWGAAEVAFFLKLGGNLLAYGGFVALIGLTGPIFASQVAYVVVAAGVGWGALVLGERHPEGFWLALALMATGLALTLPRPVKKAVDPAE
jgi:drug/metabolite transporter (DMT)-like permease